MLILSFHDTGAQFCAKVKSLRNNLALLRKFLFLLQYGTVFLRSTRPLLLYKPDRTSRSMQSLDFTFNRFL